MSKLSFGIITVSDSCSEGKSIDTSGPRLRELVISTFNGVSLAETIIIPDDIKEIECALTYFADVLNLNVVITTGGTGFSSRDVTPEATRNVIEKEAPQLTLAMSLKSFEKTKFAALSRAVCGIRKKTLIINLPGSKKAVEECFDAISDIIPHASQLIVGQTQEVKDTHRVLHASSAQPMQGTVSGRASKFVSSGHICPHKTGTGAPDDRNSIFPMVDVKDALQMILSKLNNCQAFASVESAVNIPPFRASIKDGYAMKSTGGTGVKKVIAYVAAGDSISDQPLTDDECFKINTGAAVPNHADSIIQIEDTKVTSSVNGIEKTVEILVNPLQNLDIRPIGCDLRKGSQLFNVNTYPGHVPYKSLLASIGVECKTVPHDEVDICIISTGDELTEPSKPLKSGKIYDSNSTMLVTLLHQHGFNKVTSIVVEDRFESLRSAVERNLKSKFIVCSGGVSMGDKDFLKDVLKHLNFTTHFGRVNMKPGKPMTFATNEKENFVFGLPGNPMSAFVTFHLFVLPTLRQFCGYSNHKLSLPAVSVELLNNQLELDPRPEYVRARVISKQGRLLAEVTGNQMSSRLQSIEDADVLLILPKRTEEDPVVVKGAILSALILKQFFISAYE